MSGTVVDGFRPPPQPWMAGNRGIDVAVPPLTAVGAPAAGTVLFAGDVGGALHVTVLHPDGLRTTASFLAMVQVRAGDEVDVGDTLGFSAATVHLGVRLPDGTYVDPAALFAGGQRVRLVPSGDDGATPDPPPEEEPGLLQVVVDHALGGPGDLVEQAQVWGHYARALNPTRPFVVVAGTVSRHVIDPAPCTDADHVPAPPEGRRVALLVAGLGSTSDDASIDALDTGSLGYEPGDVLRFSYAGGRIPADGLSPELAAIPEHPYASSATQGDIGERARALADLIEVAAAANPGVPLDLMAHSQGGLVTRLALAELQARGTVPAEVQVVVTLGTPHGGADLATALVAAGGSEAGHAWLQGAQLVTGTELDPAAPAVHQLAEVSDLVDLLADTPPPPGVHLRSVAARGDLVVPVPRTVAPGATQVVVPVTGLHAHSELPGDSAATREVALALAGAPPTCGSVASVVLDAATGEAISLVTDSVGATAGAMAYGVEVIAPSVGSLPLPIGP